MIETKTPVHVFRDILTDLLLQAKVEHGRWESKFGLDENWPIWYAQFIVEGFDKAGLVVDWQFTEGLIVEVPPDVWTTGTEDKSVAREATLAALTGPMGRVEQDAAKARSMNFHTSDGRKPWQVCDCRSNLTPEEHNNAFGVTSQRED